MLGAALGCGYGPPRARPRCSLRPELKARPPSWTRGPALPGAQQKTAAGSDLWQPQQVEGRGAKSAGRGRGGSVLPQSLSGPERDPHHGPPLGRGCCDGDACAVNTVLSLFPLTLLSSVLPPNTGCICLLRSFLGKKLPNQKPLPVPGGKKVTPPQPPSSKTTATQPRKHLRNQR